MLPPGAFVWTNFPFGQPPGARLIPGPSPHVAYVIGSDAGVVLLAYTSSGPWRGTSPVRPPGVLEFDAEAAATLNQKAFHLDLRILAKVAPNDRWFPQWSKPGQGVVAVAPPGLQTRILQEARRLVSLSPEVIETRGIGSDRTTTTRRPRQP